MTMKMMRLFLLAVVTPALLSLSNAVDASSTITSSTMAANNDEEIPHLTWDELKQVGKGGTVDPVFWDALTTTGLVTVQLSPAFQRLRTRALQGLCACSMNEESSSSPHTATVDLGHQRRYTLATATVGTTPLPLEDADGFCSDDDDDDTLPLLEDLRDEVAAVSHDFVQALDSRLLSSNIPLLSDRHGKDYRSVQSIVHSANHLEHFHKYERSEATSTNQDMVLDWHRDAGLFLAFVPAMDCQPHSKSSYAFWYQKEGRAVQADFPEDSIVFMLGVGAQQWLNSPNMSLKATKHAVTFQRSQERQEEISRAWYGMMFLVPDHAILQTVPTIRTFGDMKKSLQLNNPNRLEENDSNLLEESSIGCGYEPVTAGDDFSSISTSRRRLQHAVDPSACNNVTNFFCWMTCLDVPNPEQAAGYLTEGFSLYCLDPVLLASSGNQVSKAMEPCAVGRTHNSDCLGSWQPSAPGIDGAPIQVELPENFEEPYCYGGTSMYMDGFHWTHSICVIYLFPFWILSSRGRLILAALGTIVFGMLLEVVIMKRRSIMAIKSKASSETTPNERLMYSAAFYGVQLSMGYMIMLVVMTYSGVLFLCSILGIVLGHILFNAKDALWFRNDKKNSVKISTKNDKGLLPEPDICLADCPGSGTSKVVRYTEEQRRAAAGFGSLESVEQGNGGSCQCKSSEPTVSAPSEEDGDDENDGIPEGSTPCCQHTL